MYKIGPVLCASHGIGGPSMLVMLHEVTKLLRYAGVTPENMRYIRLGTSGGLGIPGGTVVISDKVFNAALEPWFPAVVLGKHVASWNGAKSG